MSEETKELEDQLDAMVENAPEQPDDPPPIFEKPKPKRSRKKAAEPEPEPPKFFDPRPIAEKVPKPDDWPEDVIAVQLTIPVFTGQDTNLPKWLPQKISQVVLDEDQRKILYMVTQGLQKTNARVRDKRFNGGTCPVNKRQIAIRWLLENIDVPQELLDQFPKAR